MKYHLFVVTLYYNSTGSKNPYYFTIKHKRKDYVNRKRNNRFMRRFCRRG